MCCAWADSRAFSQRLDRDEWLVVASTDPVFAQLRPVCLRPLDDKPLPSRRQPTSEDRQVLDIDGRLVLAIASVEMRTPAVVRLVVVHPNHYPLEGADPWHRTYVRICGDGTRVVGALTPLYWGFGLARVFLLAPCLRQLEHQQQRILHDPQGQWMGSRYETSSVS